MNREEIYRQFEELDKRASLGVTWILFVGIVFGHFDMNLDEHLLHFLKEFGLIWVSSM